MSLSPTASQLARRIAEIDGWVQWSKSGDQQCRSPALADNKAIDDFFADALPQFAQNSPAPWIELNQLVERVSQHRSQLVSQHDISRTDTASGKALLYDPSSVLSFEMACNEPGSIIDRFDCPGWDTWLFCHIDSESQDRKDSQRKGVSNVLVSWIPQDLVPRVEHARLLTVSQPLVWLRDSDAKTRAWAQRLGLS